jgi:hypothetical protein
MTNTLTINGADFSSELYTGLFTDVDHTYRINHTNLLFFDNINETLVITLRQSGIKQLILQVDAVNVFNGIVENWTPNEEGTINVYAIDYSIKLHGDPITKYDCAGQTASAIIADLIATHGGGLFTTSITATTAVYDDIFNYLTPLEIMQELALRENHSLRLTPTLEWIFAPRTANDLGKSYAEGTDFFDPAIVKSSNRIKNSYYVIDSDGQAYKKQDLLSAANNLPRTGFIDVPDATTEAQVRGYLDARLTKNSEVLTPTTINIPQDLDVQGTGLIRVNYAKLAWVNKLVYIVGVTHSLHVPNSAIELVNYDPDTDEALSDLFSDRRQLQKRNINTDLDLIILADVLLNVGVAMSVVVEKQVGTNFVWNESSQDEGAIWNSQPTAWNSEVTSTTMIPMTVLYTRMRDILQGEAVPPFNTANTIIELGSGTTIVMIDDTALDTPIAGTEKNVDSTYPRDGDDAEMIHQSSLDDSDVINFTCNEIGLKIGSTLMARVVLASSFTKSENEAIRVRVTTIYSDIDPIKIMTRFLNKIRDLAQGKSVQALDNANTIIEYGSGITPVTATDSDLATDDLPATRKSMTAGYPQDGTDDGTAKFSTEITNSDIVVFDGYELGLFENTDLLFRFILESALPKKTGEKIKTEIKIRFIET